MCACFLLARGVQAACRAGAHCVEGFVMTLAADAQLLVIVGAVVGVGHGIAGAVSLRSRIAALCQGADPFAIVLSTVVATVVVCAGADLRYAWRQARRAIDRHGLVYLIKLGAFRLLRLLPSVQAKIAREGAKTTKTIQDELLKETRSYKKTTELPAKGLSQEAVLAQVPVCKNAACSRADVACLPAYRMVGQGTSSMGSGASLRRSLSWGRSV